MVPPVDVIDKVLVPIGPVILPKSKEVVIFEPDWRVTPPLGAVT